MTMKTQIPDGAYYHTEILASRAGVAIRRGQVRLIGGRRAIVLHPAAPPRRAGEWVIGWYCSHGSGVTTPAETRSDLARWPVDGRVRLAGGLTLWGDARSGPTSPHAEMGTA